jgi:hypothetical protein
MCDRPVEFDSNNLFNVICDLVNNEFQPQMTEEMVS